MTSPVQLTLAAAVALLAAHGVARAEPLDVKLGTWETTVTTSMKGLHLAPDRQKDLSPEQRARFEAAMKALEGKGPRTQTNRSCVTKEDLAKAFSSVEDDEHCKSRTLVGSGKKREYEFDCGGDQPRKGKVRIEALSREHVKGDIAMAGQGGAYTATIDSKWISSDCKDADKDH